MTLSSGYQLPFTVDVPKHRGFFRARTLDVRVSLRSLPKESVRRLNRAFDVFSALAAIGALSGEHIAPGGSGVRITARQHVDDLLFNFVMEDCSVDDRSVVVLAHLLFRQRNWLPVEKVQIVSVEDHAHDRLAHDSQGISTFPRRYGLLRPSVEGEDPEGEGVTIEVVFGRAPNAETIKVLNDVFDVWSGAILRGAYSLPPLEPEESHLESYDKEVTVIGQTAERSFHNVKADDAAFDAIVNALGAVDERCEPIRAVRIT
jgi:hypothetical protein